MPDYRSVAAATGLGNVSTFTCSKPAGAVAGDMLLAFQYGSTPIANMALAAGGATWQVAYALGTTKIYWKIAGGSESSSYTVSHDASGSSDGSIISIAAVQDPVNIVPVVTVTPPGGGNTSTLVTPSFTPNAPGNLDFRLVNFTSASSVTITSPATYTEISEREVGSPVLYNSCLAVKKLTSVTPTGTQAFTVSANVTAGRYTIQLVSPDQGFTGWGMPI